MAAFRNPAALPSMFKSSFARWLAMACIALLSGCASLPAVQPAPSRAIAPSMQTTLGRVALSSTPAPDFTGFRLLPAGSFALDARLTLAERAQQSLDVQYYVLGNDDTGRRLLRSLRDAAARGVRVRLLIDDLYTAGEDELLLGLQAHPNVEVRLFNPFPAGRSRLATKVLASLADFRRINHRMHNKLFIADGAVAIAGGRNIADEYFGRSAVQNFIDLDALMVGGAVWQLQSSFDEYWNSSYAYPLHAIARSDKPKERLRREFDGAVDATPPPPRPPAFDVLGYPPIGRDIDAGWLQLVWSKAVAFADPPDKIVGATAQYGGVPLVDVQSVRYEVLEQIEKADAEVAINSPYFVPGEKGLAMLSRLAEKRVRVSLLTNSLASSDEPLVAMGYRRYRNDLLAVGVELYELSPAQVQRAGRFKAIRDSIGRLHAKTAVIDQKKVFFGSMNFDPRSESVNTELGVFADSPQLAEEMLRLMTIDRAEGALRVTQGDDGTLRWAAPSEDGQWSFHSEPGADLWHLWWWNLLSPLAPEELL